MVLIPFYVILYSLENYRWEFNLKKFTFIMVNNITNNMANKADKIIDEYKFILDKFIIPELSSIVMNYMMNEFTYINVKNKYLMHASHTGSFTRVKNGKKFIIKQITDKSMVIEVIVKLKTYNGEYREHEMIDMRSYNMLYSSTGHIKWLYTINTDSFMCRNVRTTRTEDHLLKKYKYYINIEDDFDKFMSDFITTGNPP